MLKGKNVLTNGCSFSRGRFTWPYRVQQKTNCNLVNLAMGGAGNRYILDTTIRQLQARKYDLVMIMWSGISRVDIKVEDSSMFDRIGIATSARQHKWFDFPERIIHPIDESSLIEQDWVMFGPLRKNEIIDTFCATSKYESIEQMEEHFAVRQFAMQSVLKSLGIPYVFMYYMGNDRIPDSIDKEHVLNHTNLGHLFTSTGRYGEDNEHPNAECQDEWSDIIIEHLKTKTYAKK